MLFFSDVLKKSRNQKHNGKLCSLVCRAVKGLEGLVSPCGVVGEMAKPGQLWCLSQCCNGQMPLQEWGFIRVPCGHKGSGTQGSRAFNLRHLHTHRGKAGLASPWLFFQDSHYFFLVAKILTDLLEPLWRDGKHPMRLVGSHSWCPSLCAVQRAFVPWKTDRCKGGGEGSRKDTYCVFTKLHNPKWQWVFSTPSLSCQWNLMTPVGIGWEHLSNAQVSFEHSCAVGKSLISISQMASRGTERLIDLPKVSTGL